MNYQTFQPHTDLKSFIQCYWTLEIPAAPFVDRQRIVPDGCLEMAFILGDDVRRFTTGENFVIQPRAMVLGHTIAPFYIQPTGYVNTFAIRFYPHGFANFIDSPVNTLANTETPINQLFGESTGAQLQQQIIAAADTQQRIQLIETFFLNKLLETSTIDSIVKSTIDALLASNGSAAIKSIMKHDLSKRRQLERKFSRQVGVSPKQLGRLIRLQTALKLLLNRREGTLTRIAYESDYYDQKHFIKDFKEFTGTTPKEFLTDEQLALSALFYGEK